MKKLLIFLCLAALPAAAQWRRFGEQPRVEGFFGVGAATPVNPVGTRLDTGWSLAGGVGVTGRYLGVLFDVSFTDLGVNRETLRFVGAPRGAQKYWSLTVNPIVHINRRGPVDFYLTGGGGLYSRTTDYRLRFSGPYPDADLLYSDTIYKPGVNGGAGFAFNIGGYHNRVKLFAEARYHHMFIGRSGAGYIPVTLGVRF